MNRSESKYFNTALRMDHALISLLEKKSLEYISVKEICEKVDVNRSTFYLHYETINDLLTECVEEANKRFLTYFRSSTDTEHFVQSIKEMPLEDLVLITPEYLIPYLTFVRENKVVFTAATHNPSVMASVDKYESLYRYVFEPILERFDYPEDERRYAIAFYINGITAIINDWLKDECRESVEKISTIIMHCIRP